MRNIGVLTCDEQAQLDIRVGTSELPYTLLSIDFLFTKLYSTSVHFGVRSCYDYLPPFILESDRSEFWNALMNDVSAEIVVLPLSLSGISPSNANGNREWFCGTIYTESRWHAGEPPKYIKDLEFK